MKNVNLVDNFLVWFDNQEVSIREGVAFEVLYYAPDFEFSAKDILKVEEAFKAYLTRTAPLGKVIGMLLYIKNAIDFVVHKYDDIDDFIQSQNIKKSIIESGEMEERDMTALKNNFLDGAANHEKRKIFKENWINYRDNLNFNTFDKLLLSDFISKK
jgi:hypothetical protein